MNGLLLDWPSLFNALLSTSHIVNSVAMCLQIPVELIYVLVCDLLFGQVSAYPPR